MKIVIALAILVVVGYSLLAGGDDAKLNPEQFSTQMANESGVLIDVRTPKEYNEGHLEGATNIDFFEENFAETMKGKDKNQTYYVYCRSGGRSGKTLKMMKDAGFKKVYDLAGGVIAWEKANKPLVK